MSFYDRYSECCKMKGIAPVSQGAADKLGCTKATISSFARNGNTPKGDFVVGAAKMLNVSADYLLGLIEAPRPISKTTPTSHIERQAVRMFRNLNTEGQQAALAMLSGLCSFEAFRQHEPQ